jgi:hypothetical protein
VNRSQGGRTLALKNAKIASWRGRVFWSSLATAGAPGTAAFNPAGHRAFWRRWLKERVPSVLGPKEQLLALLNEEGTCAEAGRDV